MGQQCPVLQPFQMIKQAVCRHNHRHAGARQQGHMEHGRAHVAAGCARQRPHRLLKLAFPKPHAQLIAQIEEESITCQRNIKGHLY